MGIAGAHSLDLVGLAGDERSAVHRRDPRAKLAALIGITCVAVSAPLERWPVYVACALVLAALSAAAAVPALALWSRVRLVLVPVLLVAAAAPLGLGEAGFAVAAAVGAKATIGTVSAALLGATTTPPALLRGLEAMRAPRLLVLIATFMHRYLFVVVAQAGAMRAAMAARGHRPRHALQAAAVGRAATALFLRTFDRGERVHRAMLARGYRGAVPSLEVLRFTPTDAAVVALVLLPPLLLRVALEVAA